MKFSVSRHKLVGEGVEFKSSPNHSEKFNSDLPDTIVIHFTAGSSYQSSVDYLCSKESHASAHLVIGRGGEIGQLIPFDTVAWHAGNSHWKGRTGLNQFSIGIELDNAGELTKNEAGHFLSWFNKIYNPDEVFQGVHRNQSQVSFWHTYTPAQIEITFAICQVLCQHYGMKEIVGHEEIAPQRKIDPGPAFPLEKLRACISADRSEDGSDIQEGLQLPCKVVATKLNVRSGPGEEFNAVAMPLAMGQPVKVIARHGGWSKVEFTRSGWVRNRYLE